jgi:hypothetical protein
MPRSAAVPVVAVAVVVTLTLPLLIVAVCVPAIEPSVHCAAAFPAASVVTMLGEKDPPSEAANVIAASLTGFPKESWARTCTGVGSELPAVADCPLPPTTVNTLTDPARATAVNWAADSPATAAFSVWGPAL